MLNNKQMRYSRHGWSPPDYTRTKSGRKIRIHVVPALPVVNEVEHVIENIEGILFYLILELAHPTSSEVCRLVHLWS